MAGLDDKKDDEGTVVTPAAEAPKPAPPKAEAKPETPPGPKPAVEKEIGVEDEIPDEAQLLKLTPAALSKRLDRYSKKQLVEEFGTSDMTQIKTDLAELKTLREEREERRLATLSETERLKEETKKERSLREAAESKLERFQEQQAFEGYDRTAADALLDVIDPEALDLAMVKLKKHVKELDDDELKNPKKVFASFAADWVKKNPRYAKEVEAKPEAKPEKKPEVKVIPLNNGPKPTKRDKTPMDLSQKTIRPGQPNSMTKSEYAAFKRRQGLS